MSTKRISLSSQQSLEHSDIEKNVGPPLIATHYRVEKYVIPFSFYDISSHFENNIYTVKMSDMSVVNATVTSGNYTLTTFMSALQTALNLAGVPTVQTFVVSQNSITGLITITSTNNWGPEPSNIYTKHSDSKFRGWRDTLGYSNTQIGSGIQLTHVGTLIPSIVPSSIFVHSPELSCDDYSSHTSSAIITKSDCIDMIPVENINLFDRIVVTTQNDGWRSLNGKKSIENLRIYLKDHYGRSFSLNGVSWTVMISFKLE
jgi:hypothetical protein